MGQFDIELEMAIKKLMQCLECQTRVHNKEKMFT